MHDNTQLNLTMHDNTQLDLTMYDKTHLNLSMHDKRIFIYLCTTMLYTTMHFRMTKNYILEFNLLNY